MTPSGWTAAQEREAICAPYLVRGNGAIVPLQLALIGLAADFTVAAFVQAVEWGDKAHAFNRAGIPLPGAVRPGASSGPAARDVSPVAHVPFLDSKGAHGHAQG